MKLVEVTDKSGRKYRVNTAQIVHIEESADDEYRVTFSLQETSLSIDKANLYRIEVAFRQDGQTSSKPF